MRKKTVLVVGATGLLGRDVYKHFSSKKGFLTYGTYSSNTDPGFWKMDVTDESSVRYALSLTMPDIVINCSAISNVDLCEKDKDLAYKVNVKGLENLLNYSSGRKFIHVSTDYVFDGKKGSYREDGKRNPLCYYAETKVIGEDLVKCKAEDPVIARVAILYGSGRKNFVTYAMESLLQGKPIQVVRNQLITPTYTPDIAQAFYKLLKHEGIFHVVGNGAVSREKMAEIIRKDCKAGKSLIRLVDTIDSWIAERPANTTLCTDKIKKLGIRMSTFNKGYKKLKREMIR